MKRESDMLNAPALARSLGCSLSHARRLIESVEHIDIALPGAHRRMLRVSMGEIERALKINKAAEGVLKKSSR